MPAYRLVDPSTKKVYKYTGDRPPTQDEARRWIWDQKTTLKGRAGTALSDIGQSMDDVRSAVSGGLESFSKSHPTIAGIGRRMLDVQADVPPEKRRKTITTADEPILSKVAHSEDESWPGYLGKSAYNALSSMSSPDALLGSAVTTRPKLTETGLASTRASAPPSSFGSRNRLPASSASGAARRTGPSSLDPTLDPTFIDAEFTHTPTPNQEPVRPTFGMRQEPAQLPPHQDTRFFGLPGGRIGGSVYDVRSGLGSSSTTWERLQPPQRGSKAPVAWRSGMEGPLTEEGLFSKGTSKLPDMPVEAPPAPAKVAAPAKLAPPKTSSGAGSRAWAGLTNKELDKFVKAGDAGAIKEAGRRSASAPPIEPPPMRAADKPVETMGKKPSQFANTPDDVLKLEIQRGSNEAIEEGYARGILSKSKGDSLAGAGPKGKAKKGSIGAFLSNIGSEEGFIKNPFQSKPKTPKQPPHPSIQGFADWINDVKSTNVEGKLAGRDFKDLDKLGKPALDQFKAGSRSGRLFDLEQYLKSKTTAVVKAGLKPDVLKNIYAKIDTFDKTSDFVHYYERTANQLIANRKFKNLAQREEWILPKSMAPDDWKVLRDPISFPAVRIGDSTEPLMAPKVLAKRINNYAAEPQEHIKFLADVASLGKNISMSGGVPDVSAIKGLGWTRGYGSGINAHGANILARTGIADPTRLPKVAAYIANPRMAGRTFDSMLPKAPWAVKRGLSLTTEGHEFGVVGSTNLLEKYGKKAKEIFGKAFEDPLFQNIIPATKLDKFYRTVEDLTKGGMEREAAGNLAAKTVNNMYGGVNWESMGRSKDLQNLLRIAFVAPDWLESNARLFKGMAKGTAQRLSNSSDPTGKIYRKMIYSTIGIYIAADVVNKHNSGKHMWENGPGHSLDVAMGQSGEADRWFRPFGTAADFARLPADIIQAAVQSEDLGAGFNILKNRLSVPLRIGANLTMNQDDFGRPITGKDDYGNKIPRSKQAAGIIGEVSQMGAHPYLKGGWDYYTGRSNAEQALVGTAEAPVRYSHRPRGKYAGRR